MMKEYQPVCIQPTTLDDIPSVLALIGNEQEALLNVTPQRLLSWIEAGHSLVAKTRAGKVVAHQAAEVWPQSGFIEGRAAVACPSMRGNGIGTALKTVMDQIMQEQYPGVPIISFTEAASGIRGMVQRLGYTEIPLCAVPKEFFTACPQDKCVLNTGMDCGCKVYMKKPDIIT